MSISFSRLNTVLIPATANTKIRRNPRRMNAADSESALSLRTLAPGLLAKPVSVAEEGDITALDRPVCFIGGPSAYARVRLSLKSQSG